MKVIRRVYDWMGSKVGTAHATFWLCALFFIEASFFVIPVDPLLILYAIHNRRRALYYAFLATAFSVLGGLFGYFIGAVLWSTLGDFLVTNIVGQSVFDNVLQKYQMYQMWVVLLAAFTPLPYKAVTVSAGFCGLSLPTFILFSIIGRGARFFLVAGSIYIWGESIKGFIDKHFDWLVVGFSCALLSGIYIFLT